MLLQYHLVGNLVLINCQNMTNYVEIVLYIQFNMLNVCQPVFSIKSSNLNVCWMYNSELTCVYMQRHTHTHTQSFSFTPNRLQLILHNIPLVLC